MKAALDFVKAMLALLILAMVFGPVLVFVWLDNRINR